MITSLRLDRLNVQTVLVVAVFATIFGMAALPLTDPDFWFHLRTGQYIWETGTIPHQDPFSYTVPENQLIAFSWASQLILYHLYSLFGSPGPIFFFAGVITLTYWVLYLVVRKTGAGSTVAIIAIAWAAAASAHTWAALPKAWSPLMVALLLYILESYRRKPTPAIWSIPFLMAIWVNLHGGYLAGMAIVGTYLVGETLSSRTGWGLEEAMGKRQAATLAIVLVLSLLLLGANPDGWLALKGSILPLISQAPRTYIQEWQPPNFQIWQLKFYEALLLSFIVVLPVSKKIPSPTHLLLLLSAAYLSLESARNIPYFALVATPIWARHTSLALEMLRPKASLGNLPPDRIKITLNWLLLVLIFVSLSWRLARSVPDSVNKEIEAREYPAKAVAFLRESRVPGNMFNSYNWGGYFIYKLYPQYKVFIDGRAELLYDDAFMKKYFETYFARPGWQDRLHKYRVDFLILERDSPLALAAAGAKEWESLYSDGQAAIYGRKD